MLILKNLNSSKASVVALLKSGSGSIPRQRRNLSRPWKTLGEIERRYIYISRVRGDEISFPRFVGRTD